MKLTMTLDEDVVRELQKAHENEAEKSFEEIVNEFLRLSLEEIEEDDLAMQT